MSGGNQKTCVQVRKRDFEAFWIVWVKAKAISFVVILVPAVSLLEARIPSFCGKSKCDSHFLDSRYFLQLSINYFNFLNNTAFFFLAHYCTSSHLQCIFCERIFFNTFLTFGESSVSLLFISPNCIIVITKVDQCLLDQLIAYSSFYLYMMCVSYF